MPRLPKNVQEMVAMHGSRIRDAYLLAARVHRDRRRSSGEPYITHPVSVARILFDAGADEDILCAALLHDTLEEFTDPQAREEIADQIYAHFGDQVLFLVEAVSKNTMIQNKARQQTMHVAQIEQAFAVDIFAFFIKIADLLHNLSTIDSLPRKRREQWIHELKYQYLPLFSTYFHRIPLAYRDIYSHLVASVEKLTGSLENASHKA